MTDTIFLNWWTVFLLFTIYLLKEASNQNKRITLVSRDTLITQYNLWYCNMYDACWSHGWCLLIPCMMLVDHMDDASSSIFKHLQASSSVFKGLRRFKMLYDALRWFMTLYDALWCFMTLHDPCCNTFDDIMNDLMMFCCFDHWLTDWLSRLKKFHICKETSFF